MKKAMCIAAAVIFLFSLAGCAETAGPAPLGTSAVPVVNENVSQESTAAQNITAALFSDSKEVTFAPETEKAAEEPAVEATPDPGTSTEAPKETTEPQETAAPSRTTETPQPEKPVSRSAEPTEPQLTEQPKPLETLPPATPEPETTPKPTPERPPVEPPPPAQTEPPVAEEPLQPAFSIDDWIAYAQGYAGSVGLNLDSTATGCWDNPIVAGAHCAYLERDIQSRLNRYAKDNSILDVWIWAESRSDGSYDLYIGYA